MPADETPQEGASSTPDSAAEFLIRRINYERTSDIPYGKREFKLDRMRRLLERLGNPHDGMRIVHVAGSKGKGSTSTMIASILTAAGLRAGLFTSPHLLRLNERFQIDGTEITDRELRRIIHERIRPVVQRLDQEAEENGCPWDTPTFFEIVTAVALLHFQEQNVDAAVLEVGLGGRLDSTNVCNPRCCVITTISLDHTKQLGSTHAEIAGEKAGILKPTVPCVIGVRQPEALEAISTIADSIGCPKWILDRDFEVSANESGTFDFRVITEQDMSPTRDKRNLLPREMTNVELAMRGAHQFSNAAVATMVARILAADDSFESKPDASGGPNWKLDETAIRTGLSKAQCAARIQVVASDPTVVVDTAHNTASMSALLATLKSDFADSQRRVAVFATSKGKPYAEMLRQIADHFDQVVLTKYQDNPRGIPVRQLKEAVAGSAADRAKFVVATGPKEALERAYGLVGEGDLICVTGSFFLAAEVLEELDA